MILVVKKTDLEFIPKNDYYDVIIPDIIKPEFMEREYAEVNDEYVQLIPSAIFIDIPRKQILVYKRNGTEKRLVSQYAFMFGGHIETCDVELAAKLNKKSNINKNEFRQTIFFNLKRELFEELSFVFRMNRKVFPMKPFYVDDAGGVSSKHVCLPFLIFADFKREQLFAKEEIKELARIDLEVAFCKQYDSWSTVIAKKFQEVFQWI